MRAVLANVQVGITSITGVAKPDPLARSEIDGRIAREAAHRGILPDGLMLSSAVPGDMLRLR